MAEFSDISDRLAVARLEVTDRAERQAVHGETVFNLMLGLVVFVLPRIAPAGDATFVRATSGVLFLGAPVLGLINGLMMVRAAEAAAGRMQDLERRLAEAAPVVSAQARPEPLAPDFGEITLHGVRFAYPAAADESPFALGPVDLTLRRGEVVFVAGGNGAGKSTLIKVLLGLYPPGEGVLKVDGAVVGPARAQAYREMIGVVFSDFHLFERLYGLEAVDEGRADDLTAWMELDSVTAIREGRFERARLSTGQRKRLALIEALLVGRPVLVLDEWAADQDPAFRRKFYDEIVPALRERGLTLVAVTHDERYLHVADRVLRLDEGRLVEDGPGGEP
jgi:putative ATP-binding cassette transporter